MDHIFRQDQRGGNTQEWSEERRRDEVMQLFSLWVIKKVILKWFEYMHGVCKDRKASLLLKCLNTI